MSSLNTRLNCSTRSSIDASSNAITLRITQMYLPKSSIFGRCVVFMMSSISSGWMANWQPICPMRSGSWIPTTSIQVTLGLPP